MNHAAFADEVTLILKYAAEEKEKSPFKSTFKPLMKKRLGSIARYGVGAGLGAGAGYLAGEGLRRVWKSSTPTQRRVAGAVMGGLGVLASLATWDAMQTAAKREDDELKRIS
jgi:hypothetical protein